MTTRQRLFWILFLSILPLPFLSLCMLNRQIGRLKSSITVTWHYETVITLPFLEPSPSFLGNRLNDFNMFCIHQHNWMLGEKADRMVDLAVSTRWNCSLGPPTQLARSLICPTQEVDTPSQCCLARGCLSAEAENPLIFLMEVVFLP